MKHIFPCGVPLIILLLSLLVISHTSARFLHTKPGEKMVQHDESKISSTNEGSFVDIETINSFDGMMGLEACLSGDEECLKRRVLAEAHLDYIYTQQHKP